MGSFGGLRLSVEPFSDICLVARTVTRNTRPIGDSVAEERSEMTAWIGANVEHCPEQQDSGGGKTQQVLM